MPTNSTSRAITHLLREGADIGDGELLGDFVERRDEAALAALICRQGPMVWGVCRRLLGHHDAEDAFQAAFLVLVRKAASISPREMLGNWLYGVAHRTALHAARTAARRRAREITVNTMPDRPSTQPDPGADAQQLFDEELCRMPEIYRAVVVLCELEGRTRKEVAAQLRVPEGTVAGRLARAKTMLSKRLAKRGVNSASAALASAVPASLMDSTIQAAASVASVQTMVAAGIAPGVAHLTEEVLKAMLMSKLKSLVVLVLTLCVLGTGAGVLRYHTLTMGPQDVRREPAPKAEVKVPVPKPMPKEDKEMLLGTWHVVEVEVGGKHQAKETSKDQIWVFAGDKLVIEYDDKSDLQMTYRLDPKQKPSAIDLSPTDEREKGSTFKGIYELDGDRLKLYYSRNVAPDAKRPARFDPEDDDRGRRSFVLKRAPAEKEKEAFTAWGDEVGGLQAGLGFPVGGKRAYAHGETVILTVRVRNVGKETVPFECFYPYFTENAPTITDGDGKPFVIEKVTTFGRPVPQKLELKAGEEIALTELKFNLKPTSAKGEDARNYPGILKGTGRFHIRYAQLQGDKENALGKLATGKLELEIKADPPAAPEKKAQPKQVGAATPVEVIPTQMEMRRDATLKTFMVSFRKHHSDKNANALREFIDPRYLEKYELTDRDLVIPMPAVESLYTIEPADDGQTFLAIVDTEAEPKKKVREALLLRVSVVEGKHYITPLKAPDPKTGAFTPWILRTRTDYE